MRISLGGWQKRHTMVLLSFIAVLICYLDRVSISVAAIPLQAEFGWSATRTGAVLSVFFLGYMAFQVPSGWAARRYGPRLVLGFALAWWSVMTLVTPAAAHLSFAALIAARLLMGMGEAAMFPGAYALFSAWIPEHERSRSVGLLFSAIPMGTLLAMVSAGWLATQFGWESIFYLFGIIGVLFAVVWFRMVSDAPLGHVQAQAAEDVTVPWRALLSKAPVWALVFNSFCTSWSIYVLLSWTPLYFKQVLGVSVIGAGLLSAAPWLIMFLMTNVAAWCADALILRKVDITVVRKVMQVSGLLLSAGFLLLMPYVETPLWATLLLCGALGTNALTMAGFAPNHLDIAPKYASVLMGVANTAGTMPGIVGVFITGWIVDVTGGFDAAFILAASISIAGAIVWLLFATGRRVID